MAKGISNKIGPISWNRTFLYLIILLFYQEHTMKKVTIQVLSELQFTDNSALLKKVVIIHETARKFSKCQLLLPWSF